MRVRVDGEVQEVEEVGALDKRRKHTIEVVVDRLVINDQIRSRLADSVETALRHGEGVLLALVQNGNGTWSETLYSEKNACAACGISFDVLTPRHFSFNSPYGACPTCHGLGTMEVLDEELVVPDPERSLDDGAVQPWQRGGRRMIVYYNRLLRGVAQHYGFDLEDPVPRPARDGARDVAPRVGRRGDLLRHLARRQAREV